MSRKRPRPNTRENLMARSLDKLAQYERWEEEVLPILTRAVAEGWTRERIESDPKIQAVLAARKISIAIKEMDSSKALAAIKDTQDRVSGKAIERKEVKHSLEAAPDDQVDARLATLLGEASADERSESSESDEDTSQKH